MKTALIALLTASLLFAQELPTEETTTFTGSGNCATCHESNGVVLTLNGADISPANHWRSSMMANASKDPLWRAVVAEEVEVLPDLKQTIETTCTKCHAPMGNTEAMLVGGDHYLLEDMKTDPVANDGVSCTLCHQVEGTNLGADESYSGGFEINPDRFIYGPYQFPFSQIMVVQTNYTPVFGEQMNTSELCATCHTLFTPYVDNDGNIAGTFPEQTPYLEWLNSIYPAEATECQTCHMPVTDTPMDIATLPPHHTLERTPFWRHKFAGGNTTMLHLLKENNAELGVTAEPHHFDTTLAMTEVNMRNAAAMRLSAEALGDTIVATVEIENLTGHKLPTGIPFRRMWVRVKVMDAGGETLFESGEYDENGKLEGEQQYTYQPHYSVITSETETQVYEGVMGDVDRNRTWTLLRAAEYLKDNRLPPKGFVSGHEEYTHTGVYGAALADPDFNRSAAVEGSGADVIRYKVVPGSSGDYRVSAELLFQPVSPLLIEHLHEYEAEDIRSFLEMYDEMDVVPVTMNAATVDLTVTGINEPAAPTGFELRQNFPNPFNPETIIFFVLPSEDQVDLRIWNLSGELVEVLMSRRVTAGTHSVGFNGSALPAGVYFYSLSAASGFREVRKMVLLK